MFPFPTGIGQILSTYAKIRNGLCMSRAFEAVALDRGVTPSTIRSACTRNLGLTASRFEDFTRPGHEQDFRRLLVSRFPLLRRPIDDFLSCLPPAAAEDADQAEAPSAEAVAGMLSAWSENLAIPAEIKRQMHRLSEVIDPDRL